MRPLGELVKGIYRENPVFRLALGLCPALAVSTSVENALGMGAAATFVLLGSNITVSLIRNFIPAKVRIPCYIVVIASFVTTVELVMGAYLPELAKSLGIFLPLIVVNCIILGRAEAFASKNTLGISILDAVGMGIGFTFALTLIAAFREVLGDGKLMGYMVFGPRFQPVLLMILAPGAFITIGLLMGYFNVLDARMKKRKSEAEEKRG
ncbi:MAG: RnfABCDGE type electron transport complex subunit E [Candidatus Eisenbacteria bacterium]|nr:RnfABCDGE type electron transport complex subunit E [Candidatus Eisenbacteria bacterium]